MRRRTALGAAVAAIAAGGCSAVLGMDAPKLDPCDKDGCVDVIGADSQGSEGSSTADAPDAPVADGPGDAPHEAACVEAGFPEAGAGSIRCGGGCYPVTFCSGATPYCCQTNDDAGVPSFACVANDAACAGYTIRCLNENDCGGSDVCCHFGTHQVCDLPANCPNADLACIPGSVDDCPTGKPCDVTLVNDGVPAPYFGCEP